MRNEINIHSQEPHYGDHKPDTWEPRGGSTCKHCSYCESISLDDILRFQEMTMELADQKYGYPHKLYIDSEEGHFKFYIKHLLDIETEEELEQVMKIVDIIKDKAKLDLTSVVEYHKGNLGC